MKKPPTTTYYLRVPVNALIADCTQRIHLLSGHRLTVIDESENRYETSAGEIVTIDPRYLSPDRP